jgi:PhoPQ-activated pathogenicity-related protein
MQKYFNKHAIINFKNFKYVIKLNGFSVQEENGRWTDTSIVSIQFNNKINTAKAINFKISDVFHYKNQKVIFNINGKAFEKEVKAGDFLKFMLNKEFNNQVMTLNIPNAISPSFLGVNNDTRQLGIKIEEISFEY